jgi:homoserine acetyltransferase
MSAGALPAASLELSGPFTLESGARLPSVTVAFRTWGRPDAGGGNAVLVYGTTGPTSPRPGGPGRWGGDFPALTLASPHGHDAFLIEGEATNRIVCRFRRDIDDRGHGEASWVA